MLYQNNPAPVGNPLQDRIDDGYNIRQNLEKKGDEMSGAQARRHFAQREHTQAKRNYDEAEAEWLVTFINSNGQYQGCKNAEQREIVKDAALVRERNRGGLAQPWAALLKADQDFASADNYYLQVEIEWKATRTAAELTAQALRAASV